MRAPIDHRFRLQTLLGFLGLAAVVAFCLLAVASCGDNAPPMEPPPGSTVMFTTFAGRPEAIAVPGAGAPSDIQVSTSALITSGTTYPSIGNALWTAAGQPNRNTTTRAKVYMNRTLPGMWNMTRTDSAQDQFFSCSMRMQEVQGTFVPPLCARCVNGPQTYWKQSNTATCTYQGVSFSFPATANGPWRIFPALPYPSPQENMTAAEVIDLNVNGWHVSAVSYLDPGVTLYNFAHAPKQQEAEQIVWLNTWHMGGYRVPDLDMITSDRWNCMWGNPPTHPGVSYGGSCVTGFTEIGGPLMYMSGTMAGIPGTDPAHPLAHGTASSAWALDDGHCASVLSFGEDGSYRGFSGCRDGAGTMEGTETHGTYSLPDSGHLVRTQLGGTCGLALPEWTTAIVISDGVPRTLSAPPPSAPFVMTETQTDYLSGARFTCPAR